MKVAVVHDFRKPLSIDDIPKSEPGPGGVVVKVETCGVCHTDIHAAYEGLI
jgi:propanol-preferring alcohol dehydrogenase